MAWYNFITSSEKVLDNVLDKNDGLLAQVGEFIGNQQFTEEERAEANAETAKGLAEFVKATLMESTVRSKTRRSIAKLWIRVELFLVLLTCGVAPLDPTLSKFYWQVATSDLMFWGTMSVIGFFFGSYMLGNASNRLKPKVGK